jgi:hypothetical protein
VLITFYDHMPTLPASDDITRFDGILDNVLTVGGSAGGKKRAGLSQPQSGGLPEGAGGSANNGAAVNFAEALRRKLECCKKYIDIARSYAKKAKLIFSGN